MMDIADGLNWIILRNQSQMLFVNNIDLMTISILKKHCIFSVFYNLSLTFQIADDGSD